MSRLTGTPQPVEVQRPVTDFELEAFRCQIVDLLERHRREHFPRLDREEVTVKRGRKYARLFHDTSIYCFVDMTTGDILKAETWKKPAKHPRGNIHNDNPLECCGPYGVAYLR